MNTPRNDLDELQQMYRPKGLKPKNKDKVQPKDIRNTKLERIQRQQNNSLVTAPDYEPYVQQDLSINQALEIQTQQSDKLIQETFQEMAQVQVQYDDVLNFHEFVATGDISYDSGIPTDVAEQAQVQEVGPVDLTKIALVESGNNYNAQNPTSTAFGKYQFIDSTRESEAQKLGIQNPKTPENQEKIMASYTKSNIKALEKSGLPVNTVTAYAMHQQGAGGGKELIRAYQSGKDVSGDLRDNVVNNTPEKYRGVTNSVVNDWFTYYEKRLN